MATDWIVGLLGGLIMGAACSALLLLNGRILGVSGALGGALTLRGGWSWQRSFFVGMLVAGAVLSLVRPAAFVLDGSRGWQASLVGGVLVGAGTQLGSGCTSGHGICGIGRFSSRSLLATPVFIAAGAVAVVLIRELAGGRL